ncbi:MAG TPA: homoserine O-acetyltransferase [Campylobacterales bacterium]|nr:homoserine O-acetyltransferase [Campylobacterales bacterium]
MKITTHAERFTNPLYLESGRILEPYELKYETYGTLNEDKSNVIVVCHALTGSHHAAGLYEGDRKAGWWDEMIGDGKPIDTEAFFVICVNVIGSCFGSTGPMSPKYPSSDLYRMKFPVITISDMVKAQRILFDRLGIHRAHAIIGGSMGGMQALCFAIEHPNFASKHIILASTYATGPWAIAFNKVAREALVQDPDFKDGFYDPVEIKESGLSGLATGRMCGYISYLSPDSMCKKFGRNYVQTDGLYELFGKFEIERYLDYNGLNFVNWFDPLSFLYITKAINIFDSTRNYDSLEDSLSRIKSEITLISFSNDLLFLPREMEKIHKTMGNIGKENLSKYIKIDSDYGHDAFLVEIDKFSHHVTNALKEETR